MRLRDILSAFAALALLSLATTVGLDAQQTGAVSVTVQAANTAEPLQGVQVRVRGTERGGLTDAEGRIRLTGLQPGQRDVEARLIGFGTETSTVTVQAGETVSVSFDLPRRAVELEEIVVTGTGTAGIQKKRLGNTIATISGSELENAPTASVDEMLAARQPGVEISPSSGLAGEGAKIRVRGSSSVTQSNEPLIYLNGVRMTNKGGNFAGNAAAGTSAGVGAISPLNAIDPTTIERIEVLKGAAAATLYGTEASNGVIQIFTKTGRDAAPRWNFQVEGALEQMPTNRIIPNAGFARSQEQIDRIQQRWGRDVGLFEVLSEPLLEEADEMGRLTRVSGQVSGGGETVNYFASGRYGFHNGIYGFGDLPDDFRGPEGDRSDDRNEQVNGSANIGIFPSDKLRVQLNTYYTNTQQAAPQTSNNIFGAWSTLIFSKPELALDTDPLEEGNFFGSPVFATTREAAQTLTEQAVDHYGGSGNVTLRPGQQITLNATVGADVLNNRSFTQVPFGWNVDNFATDDVEGARFAAAQTVTTITGELRGSWDAEVGSDWTNTFTAGGQGFFEEDDTRGGDVLGFPGPGLQSLSGGTSQFTLETFGQNLNAGFFLQDQVGYKDFAFVTVGGRADVNSTFGDEFDVAVYPKASFSLVVSDALGWEGQTLSTLRVRGAYGQSGLQPGDFDRFRTFVSLPSASGPGVAPDNLGSETLKPEESTELEGGIEAGLFNERLALSGTYWHRTVNDLLVSKQFPPSGGFVNRQVVNIGEMEGEGVDVELNFQAVEGEDFSLNLHGNAAYLTQTVTDLGGAPPVKTGGSYPRYRNFIIEGFSPGAFFGAALDESGETPLDISGTCTASTEAEALAFFSEPRNPSDFEVLPLDCGTADVVQQHLGKPAPDWQGSFGFDMTFLGNFEMRNLFEYKAGNFQWQDLSGAFRRSNALIGRNTPGAAQVAATMENPSSTPQERLDAALEWARNFRALAPMSGLNQIFDADYLRWRELSLSYSVPPDFASRILGARSITISARARNLALMVNDDYPGLSPELNQTGQCVSGELDCNFLTGVEAWRMPLPRRFSLAIRMGL